jgi:predicted O-linked N-acetylglucosamine transferase (SPINDLY family)
VKDSRLLLQSTKFNDRYIKNRYLRLFAEHNVGQERIEIVASLTRKDFLAIHNRIDICLDPFPFNGLFTTCDSLWMGVPVITMRGRRYHGRMAASALTWLGMQELIAESNEEYLEKAVLLAGDHKKLLVLRRSMRDRMLQSPICDVEFFVQSVEDAYHDMWTLK